MKYKDSKGNDIKNNDILLSSGKLNPVKYKFYKGRVYCLSMQAEYSFEYFQELRPNFVKEKVP